ncbi:TPA: LPXTG cell wall anchor domain-containing protein, partial [Streptococcus equi subsp. zooepidemicus]|nr:LPXTG cell wall anchor domain-containing protein [Streptococcus equi subsp. zooepidemicus]
EQSPKGDQGKGTKPSAPKTPEKSPAPKAPKASEQAANPKASAPKSAAPSAQKAALPATGEINHPFFTLAALSVIASVGVLTLKGKKD